MTRLELQYPKTIEKINIGADLFDGLAVRETELSPNKLYFRDDVHGVWLYQANCLEFMDYLIAKFPEGKFDMIFADPPYFLSNGGITCHAGKMVKVDKGEWDKSRGPNWNHEFKTEWLRRYQRLLKTNGKLWVLGTMHTIAGRVSRILCKRNFITVAASGLRTG